MPNVASQLDEHVVLNYDCLGRIFLNGYRPDSKHPIQMAYFLTHHRGEEIPR